MIREGTTTTIQINKSATIYRVVSRNRYPGLNISKVTLMTNHLSCRDLEASNAQVVRSFLSNIQTGYVQDREYPWKIQDRAQAYF
jgi:hypothetical protein